MTSRLNGHNFKGARQDIIIERFNKVVSLFSHCNDLMHKDQVLPFKASEEWIRNVFLKKYVRLNKVQFGLGYMNFDAEVLEIDPDTFNTLGYIDIKATNIIEGAGIANEDMYFAFECKRIDSQTQAALTSSYLAEGLMRFINLKYSRLMPIAGMIGFLENPGLNPSTIAKNINEVLSSTYSTLTIKQLSEYNVKLAAESSCYQSQHPRTYPVGNIDIVHLLLNICYTKLSKKKTTEKTFRLKV